MNTCTKCKIALKADWKVCPNCGIPVKGSGTDSMKSDYEKTVKRSSDAYGFVRLDDLPAGYLIDNRYEIKRKIGQGGFGAVYLAYDRKMDVEKALKVIPEVVANDRESMKQLRHEAKVMVTLNHPNIVRVYDFHDTGPVKYIDMEYVDGETLTDLKLEQPEEKLPEQEVIQYGIQIAGALEYAHGKNILHRDIKPQNVMVTREGEVKVMDFGIAETVRSSMTRLTGASSSGSLVYMSPEQLRGKEVGKESDVYSFGAMLYDLLSGHPPFYRGNIDYQKLNEQPERIEGVSEWMNDILQKCLEMDYRNRYKDFSELAVLLSHDRVSPVSHDEDTYSTEQLADEDDTGEVNVKTGLGHTNRYVFSLIVIMGIIAGGLMYYNLPSIEPIEDSPLRLTYSITGSVTSDGSGLGGVTIQASGEYDQTVTRNSRGEYSITGVPDGKDIRLTASREGYNFEPLLHTIDGISQNTIGIHFTAAQPTYNISGRVTVNGSVLGGVTIRATGGHTQTVTTNSWGEYSITGIPHGRNFRLTANRDGYSFDPSFHFIENISLNMSGIHFTATEDVISIVTDIDGNVYRTVKIGEQRWMAENLRRTRYSNGDKISTGLNNRSWENAKYGAYAIYPHNSVDEINSDEEMLEVYGALYNWYAVNDSRGLCPTGWRVASRSDWDKLTNYFGGVYNAGGKVKSIRTEPESHPRWKSPNRGATNESSWSGIPGGARFSNGNFGRLSENGIWWSSTTYMYDTNIAWRYSLWFNDVTFSYSYGYSKQSGYSVRCLRY